MRKLNKERLEQILRDRLAQNIAECRVSGAHLLVLQDGKEVVSICEGYQNTDTREPLRRDAMYRLASMTKPVTGAATMVAVDKGYFSIHDKVEDYLPEFADMYVGKLEDDAVVPDFKNPTPLRIHHLLSNVNGLVTAQPIGKQQTDTTPGEALTSLEAFTKYVATLPLSFEPGTQYSYSGRAGFDVAARIIELTSGMPYADFVQKNIFDPLGLKDFTYRPTDEQWERFIVPTDRANGWGWVTCNLGKHTHECLPLTYTCGGAGLTATMADYAVFAEMLRQGGTYNGVQIFSAERFKEMTHPYVAPEIPGRNPYASWGLGVRVIDGECSLPLGCFGWSGAYGTHFWVDPTNQITAIYLRNSRWYDSHGAGKIGVQFQKDVVSALEDE